MSQCHFRSKILSNTILQIGIRFRRLSQCHFRSKILSNEIKENDKVIRKGSLNATSAARYYQIARKVTNSYITLVSMPLPQQDTIKSDTRRTYGSREGRVSMPLPQQDTIKLVLVKVERNRVLWSQCHFRSKILSNVYVNLKSSLKADVSMPLPQQDTIKLKNLLVEFEAETCLNATSAARYYQMWSC